MIIFDLDGTLADCEHRRHFVDPSKNPDYEYSNFGKDPITREMTVLEFPNWHRKDNVDIRFKPDWKSFYEACDKDEPIKPVLDAFIHLTQGEPFNHDVEIWSVRCESVRHKTLKWLTDLSGYTEDYVYCDRRLKMRPIGDNTPDDELKERWLNDRILGQYCNLCYGSIDHGCPCKNGAVDFVFDSDTKSIEMWRRRGIFVFDCNQGEFR